MFGAGWAGESGTNNVSKTNRLTIVLASIDQQIHRRAEIVFSNSQTLQHWIINEHGKHPKSSSATAECSATATWWAERWRLKQVP